jgi:hypothetical protein
LSEQPFFLFGLFGPKIGYFAARFEAFGDTAGCFAVFAGLIAVLPDGID